MTKDERDSGWGKGLMDPSPKGVASQASHSEVGWSHLRPRSGSLSRNPVTLQI
jgi:hypothetical protein